MYIYTFCIHTFQERKNFAKIMNGIEGRKYHQILNVWIDLASSRK